MTGPVALLRKIFLFKNLYFFHFKQILGGGTLEDQIVAANPAMEVNMP